MNGGRHDDGGDGGGEEIMKKIADSRDNLDVSNELYEKIKEVSSFFVIKVEGKMGDYEAPPGWEEVEMNETNITELQTRSTLAF